MCNRLNRRSPHFPELFGYPQCLKYPEYPEFSEFSGFHTFSKFLDFPDFPDFSDFAESPNFYHFSYLFLMS